MRKPKHTPKYCRLKCPHSLGDASVPFDLRGLRSGSMNEVGVLAVPQGRS